MVKSRKAKQSLELELIKSNRLAKIGKLLVGVVHNLNSPLNSIVGYSQFLKEDFPDNKDIDRLHQLPHSSENHRENCFAWHIPGVYYYP